MSKTKYCFIEVDGIDKFVKTIHLSENDDVPLTKELIRRYLEIVRDYLEAEIMDLPITDSLYELEVEDILKEVKRSTNIFANGFDLQAIIPVNLNGMILIVFHDFSGV